MRFVIMGRMQHAAILEMSYQDEAEVDSIEN